MKSPMTSALKICASLLALGALADSVSARDRSGVPRGAGTFTRNLGSINGRDRVFTVYAPKDLKPGAPLVLVFHGGGGDGPMVRLGTGGEFDLLADRDGFVVAYPDGIAKAWNACSKGQTNAARRWEVDDVGFAEAIVESVAAKYAIDRSRVFATGHSNGGQFSYRLALERPRLIAGIAAISSNLPATDNMVCVPQNVPVPVMIINGTADPVSYYDGGRRPGSPFGRSRSTQATVEFFATVNGLGGPPEISHLPHLKDSDQTSVDRAAWTAPGKPPVILYTVNGGGHVVPQRNYRYPPEVGRMTEDLDAPAVIWDFFSKLPPRQ
jgi:polyhydroxybutyrate depolymerase